MVLPGIRGRIYYVAKSDIVSWPSLPKKNRKVTDTIYSGSFTLASGVKWKYIDILEDKSQLTSEPQGDVPSQMQVNKLVALHPKSGEEASAAALYVNNNECVFLVQTSKGNVRVVGSKHLPVKATVNQDVGQGPAGTAMTTINIEAVDYIPAPFYEGVIATADGNKYGLQCRGWQVLYSQNFNGTYSVNNSGWTVTQGRMETSLRDDEGNKYLHIYSGNKLQNTSAVLDFQSDMFPAKAVFKEESIYKFSFDFGSSPGQTFPSVLKVMGIVDGTETTLFNVQVAANKTEVEGGSKVYSGSNQGNQIGSELTFDARMGGSVSIFNTFEIEQRKSSGSLYYELYLRVYDGDRNTMVSTRLLNKQTPIQLTKIVAECTSTTNYAAADLGFDNFEYQAYVSV